MVTRLEGGAARLAAGRALSVALGLCTAPIISRLFDPSHYGIAGLIQSVAALSLAFACLGYGQALPLTRSRAELKALLKLSLLLTLALLVPLTVLCLLGARALAQALNKPAIERYLWLVPIIFLFGSLTHICQNACTRERRFTILAAIDFSSDATVRVTLIALGWLVGGGALFLLLGRLAGSVVGAALGVLAVLWITSRGPVEADRDRGSLRAVAVEHRQFPTVHVWSGVVNVASRSLPFLLLGGLFDARTVGYYSFGERILLLPMAILGRSVGQAFLPEATEEWHATGAMSSAIRRSIHLLSLLTVFPMVALAMLGPLLFRTAFGGRWYEAGVYAQLLSPWLLAMLLAAPIGGVFLIARRARILLAANLALLAARPLGLLLGAWLGSARAAMACQSAGATCVMLYQLGASMRLGGAAWSVARLVAPQIVRSAILLLPAAVAFWAGDHRYVSMALFLAASIAYCARAYRREPQARLALGRLAQRWRRTRQR